MTMNRSTKKRIFRLAALTAIVGGALFIAQTWVFDDATADGAPYSVSLNSPATFPVDI